MKVFKYTLPAGDWVTITMPRGAEFLCVQVQHGRPEIWARVEPDAQPVAHHFRIAGTGHDLGSNVGKYLGTLQMADGQLVFHVFAEQGQP